MILSDKDLREALKAKRLGITPEPPIDNFSTSAIDLRVGDDFREWRKEANGVKLTIDCTIVSFPKLRQYSHKIDTDPDGFVLIRHGQFLLVPTLETIHLPLNGQLAARVEGRSTLARLGLGVHITAPIIHSGFHGPIVLEFINHGPHVLKLKPNETRVCQIIVEDISSEPSGNIDTVFYEQTGPFGKA